MSVLVYGTIVSYVRPCMSGVLTQNCLKLRRNGAKWGGNDLFGASRVLEGGFFQGGEHLLPLLPRDFLQAAARAANESKVKGQRSKVNGSKVKGQRVKD
eukprot:3368715-Rhodomonas_salina.1